MSYVRRRNTTHFNINGHRIRKDVFWRWMGGSTTLLLLTLIAIAWTLYSKDQMVHQAASELLDKFIHR